VVWDAWRRGKYPTYDPDQHLHLFRGRVIRLGAYGDPAAVPPSVWRGILSVASGWTGYTHAWRDCDPAYREWCMASCETATQTRQAWERGWRTYRVHLPGEDPLAGEFVCPASAEAGKRLTCQECKACDGALPGGRHVSPTIAAHGLPWKIKAYAATVARSEEQDRARGLVSLL
jgi:hypothetical protein